MKKLTLTASTSQELIDFFSNEILPYVDGIITAENNRKSYLDSAITQQNQAIADFNNQKAIADANIEKYTSSRQKIEQAIAKLQGN